jgi:hypothetical protein
MSDPLFQEAIEVLKNTLSIISQLENEILQKKDEIKKLNKLFHKKKTPRKQNGDLYTYKDRQIDGRRYDKLQEEVAYLIRKRSEYDL